MKKLLRRSARFTPLTRWMHALAAAGFALALTACAHNGADDVKPTATTAYHSGAPVTQPTPVTPSGQTRE
jgi:recombinational DNA repair protein (RecF pathway)